jgi:hypothetical protein
MNLSVTHFGVEHFFGAKVLLTLHTQEGYILRTLVIYLNSVRWFLLELQFLGL